MIRRLQAIVVAAVLVIAAFSTGCRSSSTCSTWAILVLGGSYVLVRLGLTDLEAGYAVSQLHGHVGDRMRVTYTLRNGSRLPEALARGPQPDDAARRACPGGRSPWRDGASGRGSSGRRSTRRGHFRIEPLHIRTGDPFGFFEAAATVGQGVSRRRLSAPRTDPRVAAAGGQPRGQPRVAGTDAPDHAPRDVRPAVCARRQHEPDPLEDDRPARRDPGQGVRPGADRRRVDRPRPPARRSRRGRGESPRPRPPSGPRPPIADKAIGENRAVGISVNAGRTAFLPADRGGAPAPEDHAAPRRRRRRRERALVETLIATVGRLRRGMTAVIITPSLDPAWVRPLAALRARGVSCVAVTLDAPAFDRATRGGCRAAAIAGPPIRGRRRAAAKRSGPSGTPSRSTSSRPMSSTPGRPLGEILAR